MADSRAAHSVDDIRERTNIVEIMAPHVRLRKQGKRLAGLCPFHPDQAPSFTVDADKGLWHCFGCGAGGNVFHFLMRAENLTFPEAAQRLAQRLGVELKGHRESDRARGIRDLLERINADTAEFFRRRLEESPHALEYLRKRGITDDLIARFGIGWAPPEWDRLYRHLRQMGCGEADVEKAGLCVARPRGDGCYDRFRGRVMFPILDGQERIVGFGGRLLEDAGSAAVSAAGEPAGGTPAPPAKYINSPETALFRKGRTLYGFPQARKAMGERERAIVVEGYFDAIACHAAGFTETVATLGTALTAEHLELLRRHTGRVYAAFDSDSAGMKAMLRSHELFEAARLEVRVVRLPEGQDPDSFLAEGGAEAFARELEQALAAVDYRLAVIAESHPDTEEGRLGMMQEAVQVLARVRDAVAQAHYVRRLAERCCQPNLERVKLMEQAMHRELRKLTSGARSPDPPAAAPVGAPTRVERQVLAAMLHSEAAGRWLAAEVSGSDFSDGLHRQIFELMKERIKIAGAADIEAMLAQEQREEACALLSELALADDGAAEPEADLRQAVERLCEWRDARRCRQLLDKSETAELSREELQELTELRRRRSQVTGRRSLGEAVG
jgi:DNA primase